MKYNEAYQALVLAYRDGNKLPIELIKSGYEDLIQHRKTNPVEEKDYDMSQDHHIIPLAENGPDVSDNIVKLLYCEHLIAHTFLWEIYHDDDMYDALLLLSKGKYPGELWTIDLVLMNGKYKLSRELSHKKPRKPKISTRSIPHTLDAYKEQQQNFDRIGEHGEPSNCDNAKSYGIILEYMPRPKQLYSFDLSGKFHKVWKSISELKSETGIDQTDASKVLKCATHRAASAMWMIWRYQDDVELVNGEYKFKTPPKPRKIVFQYTKEGQFVKAWPNPTIASDSTGFDYTTIKRCCDKKEKSCGGFLWVYREDAIAGNVPVFYHNTHIDGAYIAQIDPSDNHIVRYWNSLSEISSAFSVNSGHISQCCYGSKKTVKGYIWRYVVPGSDRQI